VRRRPFLSRVYIDTIDNQDRLGTNIGKVEAKKAVSADFYAATVAPAGNKTKQNDWFANSRMLVPSLSWQIIYRFPQEVFFSENSHHILTRQVGFFVRSQAVIKRLTTLSARKTTTLASTWSSKTARLPASATAFLWMHALPTSGQSTSRRSVATSRSCRTKTTTWQTLRCSPQIAFLSPCLALVAFGAVCMQGQPLIDVATHVLRLH
jgi:hypothetical protein